MKRPIFGSSSTRRTTLADLVIATWLGQIRASATGGGLKADRAVSAQRRGRFPLLRGHQRCGAIRVRMSCGIAGSAYETTPTPAAQPSPIVLRRKSTRLHKFSMGSDARRYSQKI